MIRSATISLRRGAAFGNPARTIDDLTADIRIDPANPLLFKLRGIRWMFADDKRAGETTRIKIAIRDFTESLRLWPLQPEVYLLCGIARYEIAFTAESCQDAIDDFDSALRFEDKPAGLAAWAYFFRGLSYDWEGYFGLYETDSPDPGLLDKAIADYVRMLSQDPNAQNFEKLVAVAKGDQSLVRQTLADCASRRQKEAGSWTRRWPQSAKMLRIR